MADGNGQQGSVADGQILLRQPTLETLADAGGSLKWRRFRFRSLDGMLIRVRN